MDHNWSKISCVRHEKERKEKLELNITQSLINDGCGERAAQILTQMGIPSLEELQQCEESNLEEMIEDFVEKKGENAISIFEKNQIFKYWKKVKLVWFIYNNHVICVLRHFGKLKKL